MADKNDVFYTLNATTQRPLSIPIKKTNTDELAQALSAAEEATLAFAATTLQQRIRLLTEIQKGLEAHQQAILKTYCEESGLPEGRAQGEFQRTHGQIEHFKALLKEGRFLEASIVSPTAATADIRKMLVPLGPVVVFGASNFPLAFSTAGGDTISALAAGCPVLVKAHPYHAHTSTLVAVVIEKAVARCGFPNGVFSHLCSDELELGQQLVCDLRVKAVGFTGSFRGGKALYDLAQQRPQPIPVFAEMGSVNPVFILPDVLQSEGAALAASIAGSVCLGNGQFCTNPGLIAVPKGESVEFISALKTALSEHGKGVMVHPNIQKGYENQLENLKKHHPEVVLYQSEAGGPALGIVPAEEVWKNPNLMEEVFGPFTLLITHDSVLALHQTAQILEGQLTATLRASTKELQEHQQLQHILQQKVGRLLFEGVPTGVSVTQTMMHGGPFPASSDSRFTAVGSDAIYRWLRPLAFQDAPQEALPPALQNHNPLGIQRKIDGQWTTSAL